MRKPPWSLTVGMVAGGAFLLGSVVTQRVLVTPPSAPQEVLDLLIRAPPQPQAADPPAPLPHDPFNEAVAHGITAIGPHSRTIDRATLAMALANIGQLSASARVAPERRAGRAPALRF